MTKRRACRRALNVDARSVIFQRAIRGVSEIAGPAQHIVGAAKPFIDFAKALHIVSVVELPTDDGIGQSAQNVSIFVSFDHWNWTSPAKPFFLEGITPA